MKNQNTHPEDSVTVADKKKMQRVLERNIEMLVNRKKAEALTRNGEEKIADAITGFTGSMRFVYVQIAFVSLWILWNVGWLGLKPFDPTFVVLAMVASVQAIFLSTFVLISQNRMNKEANERADLDLQISLLSEHEIARVISMLASIADKLKIAVDKSDIEDLTQDIDPVKVLNKMEDMEEDETKMRQL